MGPPLPEELGVSQPRLVGSGQDAQSCKARVVGQPPARLPPLGEQQRVWLVAWREAGEQLPAKRLLCTGDTDSDLSALEGPAAWAQACAAHLEANVQDVACAGYDDEGDDGAEAQEGGPRALPPGLQERLILRVILAKRVDTRHMQQQARVREQWRGRRRRHALLSNCRIALRLTPPRSVAQHRAPSRPRWPARCTLASGLPGGWAAAASRAPGGRAARREAQTGRCCWADGEGRTPDLLPQLPAPAPRPEQPSGSP